MEVNKVVYGSNTVMDITDTTAEASDVVKDKVFYGKNGAQTVGTAEYAPLSHTHAASDVTSGELVLARGGTGQSFADFAALSDAVGSGGNWVDVSAKLQNEITGIISGGTIHSIDAFIYENQYITMWITFSLVNAITALDFLELFTLPNWATPKLNTPIGSNKFVGTLYSRTKIQIKALETIPAGYNDRLSLDYLLDSPYNPS